MAERLLRASRATRPHLPRIHEECELKAVGNERAGHSQFEVPDRDRVSTDGKYLCERSPGIGRVVHGIRRRRWCDAIPLRRDTDLERVGEVDQWPQLVLPEAARRVRTAGVQSLLLRNEHRRVRT